MSLSALTARLNAAFQSVEPDRYAKKHKPAAGQQGFRWITLNGGSGDDGDGGTRVKIDDGGKIHAGPAALEGRDLDNLGGKPKGKPKPKAAAPKPKSDAAAKALEANETRAKGPAAKPAEAGDSGQWSPENHVKIAADSIDKLRGQDVYRLLDSAPPAMAGSMANYIRKNRPDLSGDVHDAQIDLAEERGGSGGDAGEAKPEVQKPDIAAQIEKMPPQVRSEVERRSKAMQDARDELERGRGLDKRFNGEGRYEAETHEKLQANLTKHAEWRDKFLAMAEKNGLDGNAILEHHGWGEAPELSENGRTWNEDQADKESKRQAALTANESRAKGPAQTSAQQSEFSGQEDHQRGDRVRYTGNVNADGFHEFEYLEGHRKGQKGVTDNPMGSQNQARKEKATAEFKDQQAGFKRLREAQQRQQQARESGGGEPPFTHWRMKPIKGIANRENIYPPVGKSFTETDKQQLAGWLQSQGYATQIRDNHIEVSNTSGGRVDLVDGLSRERGRKWQADKAENEARRDAQKQEHKASLSSSGASGWIAETFGGDFANDFNKAALAKFLDGKDQDFAGMMGRTWLDGIKKAGVDTEGKSQKQVAKALRDAYLKATMPASTPAAAPAPKAEEPAKPKPKMLEDPGDDPYAFKLRKERAFKPQPKSLFGNPKDYGPEQQSDLEKIEANLAQRKNEALAGQKGLYSRVRSAVNRYLRTGSAARYDVTGGKWITLNGDSGADGDGGTPVFIKPGGEIAKGPKSLKGKDLDNLPSEPKPAGDPQARRAELAKQVTDGATHAERSAARKEIAEIDRTLADDSRPKGPRGPAAAPKPPSPTAGVDEKREAALKANETRAKGPATPPRPAWMKKQPADGLEPGQEEGTFTLKREKANKPRGITGKQGALFDPTEDAVAPEQEQLPGAAKPLTRLQKKDGITVGAAQVHYSDLAVDPKRFQYKFQGIGEEGVTDELKGVKKFNPMLGGQLLAWHDPEDGKAYVVNGHHRHELARRSGEHADWDGHLPTYFVNAKTAKEARALGALANIAEGRGTAVDAAKFLRDTGTSAENLYGEHGISLKGAVARDAQILTKLSGGLFDRLATGSMETGRALAIASELGDHDKQLELVRSIEQTENKRGKALTDGTVREMAKMMDLSKTAKGEGGGLFDDFAEKSSFVERAELLAHLRRTLSTEMKTFKQAASTRRQAALESTGTNKLDVEGNRERAKSAETAIWDFDTRANARGDALATAISDAAEELANAPRKRKSIEKRLTETVRGVLAGEADGGGTDADRGDVTRNARRGRARQPSRYARQAMIRDLSRILRT